MPNLTQTEHVLAECCRNYVLLNGHSDSIRVQEVLSRLSYFSAALLNYYLETDLGGNWKASDFWADDLLDISCYDISPSAMTVTGLMCCFKAGVEGYLSPFRGEFEWDPEESRLLAYTLCFAADRPEVGEFVIPYTRSQEIREELLARHSRCAREWAHVYRKAHD